MDTFKNWKEKRVADEVGFNKEMDYLEYLNKDAILKNEKLSHTFALDKTKYLLIYLYSTIKTMTKEVKKSGSGLNVLSQFTKMLSAWKKAIKELYLGNISGAYGALNYINHIKYMLNDINEIISSNKKLSYDGQSINNRNYALDKAN